MRPHRQLVLEEPGDHRGQLLLVAVQDAQAADVAPGLFTVVPRHLLPVHGALPLRDLPQGFRQWVVGERRPLQVVLDVLSTQGNFTLQARFHRWALLVRAAVAADLPVGSTLMHKESMKLCYFLYGHIEKRPTFPLLIAWYSSTTLVSVKLLLIPI